MLSEASTGGNWGLGVTIALTLISTSFVVLRFWARTTTHFGLWLDDWLALATLAVLYWVLIISALAVDKGGLGKPIVQAVTDDPNSVTYLLKLLWAFENAYLFGSPLMKVTVLAYYWRMFPGKNIRLAIWIATAVCGIWFIGALLGNLLQCAPISKFWDSLGTAPGVCHFTATRYYVVVAIPNMIIDIVTVAMPVYEIWNLKLALWKRVGVCVIFLLGGIVVLASIVRLALLVEFDEKGTANVSEDLLLPWFVTVIEIAVAIIGACVPCLMPLYRKVRYGTADSKVTPTYHLSQTHNPRSDALARSKMSTKILSSPVDGPFERLETLSASREEDFGQGNHTRTTVRRGSQPRDQDSDEIPLQGISITHEIVVDRSNVSRGQTSDVWRTSSGGRGNMV